MEMEVIQFFDDRRVEVRKEALTIAVHLLSSDTIPLFCAHDTAEKIIRNLIVEVTAVEAAQLLSNIIAENGILPSQSEIIKISLKHVESNPRPDPFLTLISNLTRTVEMSEEFIILNLEKEVFSLMLSNFFSTSLRENSGCDSWEHVASIIANLCAVQGGRQLILQPATNNFQNMINEIASPNGVRRRGSVSCVRSCLFDTTIHWWFVRELNGLTSILLPLITSLSFTEQEQVGMEPVLFSQV